MPKSPGVYRITNTTSLKVYIGSSSHIERRWVAHRSSLGAGRHHSVLLQRAWDKYGADSFTFEVVALEVDEARRLALETKLIAAARSSDPSFGYNLAPAGGTCLGYKHSAEMRAKCAARQVSEETRQKLRAASTGRKHSAETRAKMSVSSRRVSPTQEMRQKISAVHKGKNISDEHKRIVAEVCRQRNSTPEHIAKVREARKGWRMSDDAKALLSIARKGKPISEAHKQKISESTKGRTFTPEHLAKIKGSLLATAARKREEKRLAALSSLGPSQHVAVDREPADLAEVAVVGDDLGITSG